jgi:hypothetical protein
LADKVNILSEKRKMDVNVSMAEIYWHQSDDDAGAAPQWVQLFSEGGWAGSMAIRVVEFLNRRF